MQRSAVRVNTPNQRAPGRAVWAWLLMLAVLFGQGLGAVHSISHGAAGVGGHAHADTDSHAHAHAHAHGHSHGRGLGFGPPHLPALTDPLHGLHATAPACDHGPATGLQALFDHAPDEPGCRLYDQLLQAGPLMPVSTVLARPARTRALVPPAIGVRLAAPAAVYLARGPPRA